jgi:hypothetical protein
VGIFILLEPEDGSCSVFPERPVTNYHSALYVVPEERGYYLNIISAAALTDSTRDQRPPLFYKVPIGNITTELYDIYMTPGGSSTSHLHTNSTHNTERGK